MDWAAEGLVLAMRPHGEASAIVDLFTAEHGRHSGLVRGGAGRRLSPHLQPGNHVHATWRGRLENQLGQFKIEPLRARASRLMEDADTLVALGAITALLTRSLPEREPHPALFAATCALIDALIEVPDWPMLYVKWELGLLTELGFGLDLSECAVTGARQGLAFVSPKTGRAVTHEGAGPWQDRLLPLPAFLTSSAPLVPSQTEITEGLQLTGHFLARALTAPNAQDQNRTASPLPEGRLRLSHRLAKEKVRP